ncbi:hypothetical protein HPB50_001034 [Hyalomma asiaticum]|uniref:Uncharacterized protein n=1 Tax=Hyalomma asiaticum TaxID=266040 RepID=A0ACB7RTI2_HYAAI|nr:hypothetical protein HPB50_001034 [Hyalomma asiaticum]
MAELMTRPGYQPAVSLLSLAVKVGLGRWSGRYLDETCARDSDCESLVNNSYCSGDRCECKNGYIREGALPEDQHCEIDRGGRGALKILFALMLPVVVCAFVYLYSHPEVLPELRNPGL